MTELYLNGYLAVMDKSTKIKVVFDNAYFTKSSTYTHDISLPMLSCPQNQKIFGPINRKDVSKGRQTLKAVLVVDNKVLLNGTAIVREVTDQKAQVQLVSGNAEMNFFMQAEEIYIDQLYINNQFGMNPLISSYPDKMVSKTEQIRNWADYDTNERGFVFFPAYNETSQIVINGFSASYINIDGQRKESFARSPHASQTYPQPYLCKMIKWIMEAIGYYIAENQLETTVFRNLFICNSTYTWTWKDVLPHWTINEFLANIEKAFGLITVVDEGQKSVRLLFSHRYFDESNPICISEVEDSFTTKIDADNSIDVGNGNIGYSLDSSGNMMYAKIDVEIISNTKLEKFDNFSELEKAYRELDDWNRPRRIFEAEGVQYMEYDNNGSKALREINQFRDLMRNQDKEVLDIELKIVPANMTVVEVEVYAPGSIFEGNYLWTGYIQALSLPGGDYGIEQFIERTTQIMIEEGIPEKYKPEKIIVAFSDGQYKNIYGPNGESFAYPAAFVDGKMTVGGAKNQYPSWSLRLCDDKRSQNIGSEIYDKVNKINTVAEENFRFISTRIHSPRSVFIIDNKKYVSKSITVECAPTGIEKTQEAIMYEVTD